MKQNNFYLILILVAILWLISGIVPLIAGYLKKKLMLGFIGFISSVIGSLVFGSILGVPLPLIFFIFGLPLSLIFTLVIILKKSKRDSDGFAAPPNPPKFN